MENKLPAVAGTKQSRFGIRNLEIVSRPCRLAISRSRVPNLDGLVSRLDWALAIYFPSGLHATDSTLYL